MADVTKEQIRRMEIVQMRFVIAVAEDIRELGIINADTVIIILFSVHIIYLSWPLTK
jgi:hypothetical protein